VRRQTPARRSHRQPALAPGWEPARTGHLHYRWHRQYARSRAESAHSDSTPYTQSHRCGAIGPRQRTGHRPGGPVCEAGVWDQLPQVDATFSGPSIIRRSSRSARRSWWMTMVVTRPPPSPGTHGVVSLRPVLRSPGETYLRDVLSGRLHFTPAHTIRRAGTRPSSAGVVSPSHREAVTRGGACRLHRCRRCAVSRTPASQPASFVLPMLSVVTPYPAMDGLSRPVDQCSRLHWLHACDGRPPDWPGDDHERWARLVVRFRIARDRLRVHGIDEHGIVRG
jgi:hypothetical protein